MVPKALADSKRGERLQVVLAHAGVASRRQCESMILQGRVTVNGEAVTGLPAWVNPAEDRIEVDGRELRALRETRRGGWDHVYIILNKPRRVVSTSYDPQGRPTVLDVVQLPPEWRGRRLYPVGRLDADSTGLILLTDDGELTQRLTHPRHEVAKEYHVSIRGRLTPEELQELKEGLRLVHTGRASRLGQRGVRVNLVSMADVRLIGYGRDRNRGERTRLHVTLREGKNRQIRRMLARLGYKVRRLERVAIGPISLKGLALGEWRPLSAAEVQSLRKAAGLLGRGEESRGKRKRGSTQDRQ